MKNLCPQFRGFHYCSITLDTRHINSSVIYVLASFTTSTLDTPVHFTATFFYHCLKQAAVNTKRSKLLKRKKNDLFDFLQYASVCLDTVNINEIWGGTRGTGWPAEISLFHTDLQFVLETPCSREERATTLITDSGQKAQRSHNSAERGAGHVWCSISLQQLQFISAQCISLGDIKWHSSDSHPISFCSRCLCCDESFHLLFIAGWWWQRGGRFRAKMRGVLAFQPQNIASKHWLLTFPVYGGRWLWTSHKLFTQTYTQRRTCDAHMLLDLYVKMLPFLSCITLFS